MRIDEYITHLRNDKNIIISVADNQLNIAATREMLTPEVIEEIKAKKGEILEFFKMVREEKDMITPVSKKEHYALSHAQRRLWVLDQLVDVKGIYNVPSVYTFEKLDIEALKRSIIALIERHEILRTTIHMIEGEPRQIIHSMNEFKFEIAHFQKKEEELEVIITKEMFSPFDLSHSPIRATLIEKPDGSIVFIFMLHHIVTDGWSATVLQQDLMKLYDHYGNKAKLQLQPLKIQYKDYSHWQHEQLKSGKLDVSRDYWKEKLSGDLPVLKLPLDRKRGKVKNHHGSSINYNIPTSKVQQLTILGNEKGATLFMVLVSILDVLFYRYTNQTDIILGTPVTGRNHPELENQVGFYSNTIVFRSKFDATDTFGELLQKVNKIMLKGYEHQYYPFDLLVDELNLDRDMNRNPLFDVMVSYNDITDSETLKQDKEVSEEINSLEDDVNKFDLSFSFVKNNDGTLHVDINYDKSIFFKEKILRMAQHIDMLLADILKHPDKKLHELSLLPKKEQSKILDVFNNTYRPYNLKISIKEFIETQVKKTPEEIAVFFKDTSITFKELNNQANKVANYLKEQGIVKGDIIGIMMGSTVDRLIAILSAIKLGAIYVPIDPDYPKERIGYILNDTKMCFLFMDNHTKENLDKEIVTCKVKVIEVLLPELEKYSIENPVVSIDGDDIFIILYTSGSTGNPKGVLIKNNGLMNRMQGCWDNFNFIKDDIIYQKTNFVFDVSLGEFFLPLCFGAKLLIAEADSSIQIINTIKKYGVTHIWFSPTTLNRFINHYNPEKDHISSLKYVFSSGEELLKKTVANYYNKFSAPLINQYGPTEASIDVTAYEAKVDDEMISLGKPIPNVKLYIIDEYNKLLPIGIPGEIGIGGVALAKGYLNSEELTSEKFITNSYELNLNEKIYKTGDIGCWNEKGEIEFLGRRDNQVSIWGTRVELSEIESTLTIHPKIKETAVIVEKDTQDNDYLVAYYVKNNVDQYERKKEEELQYNTQEKTYIKSIPSFPKIEFRIDELFDKAAINFKDKIALKVAEKEVTYKELQNKVNNLAAYLNVECGVRNGNTIGIITGRSEKMIIAILAAIKVGGVYVPIDPDYPEERISYMINDAAIKWLITDKSVEVPKLANKITIVFYDDVEGKIIQPVLYENKPVLHSDLCYICYTSGSTGTPKGVMVEHGSVSDYIQTFTKYFTITEKDVVIQQSSISFDTAVEEIFPILCAGGTLVVLPKGGRDIDGIINAINEKEITLLSTTPLVINELNMRKEELKRFPKTIISGGDALQLSYINALMEYTNFYNTYGPTEATVCVTYGKVQHSGSNIGSPIANHAVYIVGEKEQLLPVGSIGEMYLAGPGVARGYINKQGETSKYFIPNPFGVGRCYKTGDLARWTNEGTLEFCGRKDNQVKIRGYRVEPEEININIATFERIKQCITIPQKDLENKNHLVTYYISDEEIKSDVIRNFIKEKLPHYMIPDYYVKVEEFPRTLNGKIDVKALPVPEILLHDLSFSLELKNFLKQKLPHYMVPIYYRNLVQLPLTATGKIDRKALKRKESSYVQKSIRVLPVNSIEKNMLDIWKLHLRHIDISTNDNFFEIGGDSLKATQIVSAIYKSLKAKVTLKDIFNNPTIKELSDFLLNQKQDETLLVKLNNQKEELPAIFFIPPIIGSSTIFRNLAMTMDENYNAYGFQYKGFDSEAIFDSSIELMAKTFVKELKKIYNKSYITLVGYSMGVPIAFEMAKILERENCEISLIFLDRGIQDKKLPSENNLSIDKVLEEELPFWLNELTLTNTHYIGQLVRHNLEILANYKVQGKVNSRIAVVEAMKNIVPACMKDWENYTNNEFTQYFVNTNHFEILNKENEKIISEILLRYTQPQIQEELT